MIPLRIRGGGKGNGVVFFALRMVGLRQNHQFMASIGPADVDLRAAHEDAVFVLVHDFQRQERVRPVQGLLVALAARLGKSAGHGEVFALHHLKIFEEPWGSTQYPKSRSISQQVLASE